MSSAAGAVEAPFPLEAAERVILDLAVAIEGRDSYTPDHVARVAANSTALARLAGIQGQELEDLWLGAAIHDIGKIGVPDTVLLKRARLTTSEMAAIRRHTEIGERLVAPLRPGGPVASIVRHHHERIDGAGYPDGLSGEEIGLGARIVAVCESFDAMTTVRLYRQSHTPSQAMSILRQGAGTHWDPALVELFLERVAPLVAAPPSAARLRRRYPFTPA